MRKTSSRGVPLDSVVRGYSAKGYEAIAARGDDALNQSASARPHSFSFSYHSAVSMCLYPASSAHLTLSYVSLSDISYTPRPN